MNQANPFHSRKTSPLWQGFGEMKLPASPDDSDAILSLLAEKLELLQLPVELVHRIVKSIQEVFERVEMGGLSLEHNHLFLFVPASYRAMGRTWGFFCIDE